MLRKYAIPLLASILFLSTMQVRSQSSANSPATAVSQRFDVVSIRPSPDRTGQSGGGWMGVRLTGDMFEARDVPVQFLVSFAYVRRGAERELVADSGGWIQTQHWDIMAKVDDPSFAALSNDERKSRMVPMLRSLLDERFHLKFHTELKPTQMFALVQAKGGAKVKEVPAPPEVNGDWMEAMKHFQQDNPGKPFPGVITCSGNRCTATATTVSDALGQIEYSSHAGRMLLDETGLKGHYDFSFRSSGNDNVDAMADVEEDLGMKFEPRKVNLTTYVIDSAEKPSEN